jgi:hypothetical protein
MQSTDLLVLVAATKSKTVALSDLLADPGKALAPLNIKLAGPDIRALSIAAEVITARALEHDVDQGRTGKRCVFIPILGTLPSKRPRKKPSPPKRPQKPKPS